MDTSGLTFPDHLEPVTVGKLFPAGDVVAEWVYMLSVVAEDLAIADVQLTQAIGDETNGQSMFHYRVLVARMYEARRVVLAAERDEIGEFVRTVTAAHAEWKLLREQYIADGEDKSRVDELYAVMRHRTVHHSFPASPEVSEALTAAAELEAFYILDHDKGSAHFIWPEYIAICAFVGAAKGADRREDFRKAVQLAREIVVAFIALFKHVLDAHCARIGIQHEQLIRHRGQASPPPNREARRRAARENKKKRKKT